VAAHKTLTLSVDGLPMTVSTMKSRVIDVVRQNGFAVGEHDSVYPGANQPVHQSDTIVLRRVGRHVPQLDLTHAPEQSRRTIEKPTKIAVATPAGPAVPATSRSPQARLPRRPFKGLAPSMREGASPQRQHLRNSEATAEVLWLRPSP